MQRVKISTNNELCIPNTIKYIISQTVSFMTDIDKILLSNYMVKRQDYKRYN